MNKKIQCLLLLIAVFTTNSKVNGTLPNPYCNIKKCHKDEHTLCKFPLPGVGPACGEVIRNGLNQFEIQRILLLHNAYRTKVHSGMEMGGQNGVLPRGKSISRLQWDYTLADIAQRWAEQCRFGHDRCRNMEQYLVGQNVGFERIVNGDANVFTVDLIIAKWYKEVERCTHNDILNFNRKNAEEKQIHHFTQMIWQYTNLIGCGGVRYNVEATGIFFLVCNYAPKGNFDNHTIYETYLVQPLNNILQ